MSDKFTQKIAEKTDDELVDIYLNSSDYQTDFVDLVKSEIKARNLPLDSLENIKGQKEAVSNETLELGKQGNQIWMAIALFASIFGGFIGIISGYIYAFSKHRNGEGKQYFVYNESTRKYGKIVFFIGVVVFILFFVLRFI